MARNSRHNNIILIMLIAMSDEWRDGYIDEIAFRITNQFASVNLTVCYNVVKIHVLLLLTVLQCS